MYVSPDFATKKALKSAVTNGEQITVFQPNNIFRQPTPTEGVVTVEGPHFPRPHSWYAQVTLSGGRVVKVK